MPAVITFPPVQPVEEISSTVIPTTTTTAAFVDDLTTIIEDENTNWEEGEVEEEEDDFVLVGTTTIPTTVKAGTGTTKSMVRSTSSLVSTTFSDDFDSIDEPSTLPVEHFELIENMPASSTIAGGMAVAQDDSELNWWDMSESFTQPLPAPNPALATTTHAQEDQSWDIFNTTTVPVPSVTRFEQLSVDGDMDEFEHASVVHEDPSNADVDFDMNDYFLLTTTVAGDSSHQNDTFVPYFFNDYKPNDQQKEFLNLIKPIPTLAMPPFSWMLQQANQTKHGLTTSTVKTTTKKPRAKGKMSNTPKKHPCHGKQCQNGGRLNTDCLCICLPAFTGDSCQNSKCQIIENKRDVRLSSLVHCDEQPKHICDFLLDHECKSDYVRYLCPKFCRMDICSSRVT